MRLKNKEFIKIIEVTPLVAIDLIIQNQNDEVLLGKRINKPAQGYWFVPGGRIRKNETIANAFQRILKNETGLDYPFQKAALKGCYDHFYDDNFAGIKNINTHYVVLAYGIQLPGYVEVLPDTQHDELFWWRKEHILNSDLVHQNTKNYFNFST